MGAEDCVESDKVNEPIEERSDRAPRLERRSTPNRRDFAANLQALAAQLRTLDYSTLNTAENRALDDLLRCLLECFDETADLAQEA
jgi:hypothetical protein